MELRIENILFASDLTDDSRHAFKFASSLAVRHEASMILLHVLEKVPIGIQQRFDVLVGAGASDSLRLSRERQAKDILIWKRTDLHAINKALAEYYRTNGQTSKTFEEMCQILIREGKAPEEVIKAAQERQCDLVVLGAHRRGLGGPHLGKVVKYVLNHASIPVLVVPPKQIT